MPSAPSYVRSSDGSDGRRFEGLAIEDTLMNTPTAVQLLRNTLDRFLAKDMKGWVKVRRLMAVQA